MFSEKKTYKKKIYIYIYISFFFCPFIHKIQILCMQKDLSFKIPRQN